MVPFKVFSRNPFLVFRVSNYVYKFFDPISSHSEYSWVSKKYLLDKFNLSHQQKIEIPEIDRDHFFIKIRYIGDPIVCYPSKFHSLYDIISRFSIFYQQSPSSSISIGDAQIRNVYLSPNGFYFLDLGINFGKSVSIYYDRVRFLVHLVDSDYKDIARDLLYSDPQKDILIEHIRHRANLVFFKRLSSFAIFSAVYRYLSFICWQIML